MFKCFLYCDLGFAKIIAQSQEKTMILKTEELASRCIIE